MNRQQEEKQVTHTNTQQEHTTNNQLHERTPPPHTQQRSKVTRRRCVPPPTPGWVAAPKSAWEVGSKSDAPGARKGPARHPPCEVSPFTPVCSQRRGLGIISPYVLNSLVEERDSIFYSCLPCFRVNPNLVRKVEAAWRVNPQGSGAPQPAHCARAES